MISLIYGPAGAGKTTLCLQAASIHSKKSKIVFIDTENSFSLERIKQMNNEINLDNIIIIKADSYSQQFQTIKSLESIHNQISLVIIDSFTKYYRKKFQEQINITPPTIKQLQYLKKLNLPIILTSQVYTNKNKENIPLASHLWKNFANNVIELKNENKRLLRYNNQIKEFKITEKGIIFLDEPFSILPSLGIHD